MEPERPREGDPNSLFSETPGTRPASHPELHGSSTLISFSTSSEPQRPGPQLVQQNGPPTPPSPVAIWIDRIGLIIKVIFYIELGMLLVVLPWIRVWTDNNLVLSYPTLRAFLQNNFVRGAVTGIGLVDIWIGIWEAVHYRDRK
jgi:hypothetical protein